MSHEIGDRRTRLAKRRFVVLQTQPPLVVEITSQPKYTFFDSELSVILLNINLYFCAFFVQILQIVVRLFRFYARSVAMAIATFP